MNIFIFGYYIIRYLGREDNNNKKKALKLMASFDFLIVAHG